ncbi:hypothetical protein IFM89_017155 [Coptis chinensis]|uniref:GPI-anchored protein LLG1-like domain-containing protein n=1 Tax=Coptis chinensis TaxID=261450 RepID=A0A835HTE1_9MAGN|nr:hypothetical protein IFM89_017155 [Coptis chinensis]
MNWLKERDSIHSSFTVVSSAIVLVAKKTPRVRSLMLKARERMQITMARTNQFPPLLSFLMKSLERKKNLMDLLLRIVLFFKPKIKSPVCVDFDRQQLLKNRIDDHLSLPVGCPQDFEFQNYTIITSQCKGPQYPPTLCCDAFKRFACPYAAYINDLASECAYVMFSYINLYGKYPPGLFASECQEGKAGLDCTGFLGDATSDPPTTSIERDATADDEGEYEDEGIQEYDQ